jgi:hypothetical protein
VNATFRAMDVRLRTWCEKKTRTLTVFHPPWRRSSFVTHRHHVFVLRSCHRQLVRHSRSGPLRAILVDIELAFWVELSRRIRHNLRENLAEPVIVVASRLPHMACLIGIRCGILDRFHPGADRDRQDCYPQWVEDPVDLSQGSPVIGNMLKNVRCVNEIERVISEGEPRDVGS